MNCRHCQSELRHTCLDLGFAPPSNAYLVESDLSRPEKYFPLRINVCDQCWLVQTEDYADADQLFTSDYAYFSSTSLSWLAHANAYSHQITEKLGLTADSFVLEVASNDGYLLRNFVEAGIPCLGIEPTAGTADVAEKLGIPVWRQFFGEALGKRLAHEGKRADLIVGNNVYAHVPDINDFTRGLKAALKANGTITLEFPHVMRLLEDCLFDTVYHEHFSYLSLYAACRVFERAGLRVYHVDTLATHGGSLRLYGCHQADRRLERGSVATILQKENAIGMRDLALYRRLQQRANAIKDDLLTFLIAQKRNNKKVIGYGAAAKGNTLLNFAGIKRDLLPLVCDAAPSKQGKYLPGTHIPIAPPNILQQHQPDYLLILPWNIAAEVREQNSYLAKKGTKFVTAVPSLTIS